MSSARNRIQSGLKEFLETVQVAHLRRGESCRHQDDGHVFARFLHKKKI